MAEKRGVIIRQINFFRDVRCAIVAIIIICVNATSIAAQEQQANVITDIQIEGLTRTKLHVVTNALDRFIGADVSEFDENEVVAAIMNLGVLQHIATDLVENENGGATLLVTVQERRTMLPFPMVMSGSGGNMGGVFVLQSNAFGVRDMAVLGAMIGDFGWSAMAIYNHTPRRPGLPGANAMFMYGHNEITAVNKDEDTMRVYSTEAIRAALGVNYTFADFVTPSFSISYSDVALNDDADTVWNAPDSGATMLIFSPSLTLRKSTWDGYFLSQQTATLRYNYNHALSGESYHTIELSGGYEQSLRPGFRLNLRGGAIWKSTNDPLFEDGPSRTATSILPRNFAAMQYAGGSVGVEKQLRRRDWGSISSLTSWQGVYYEGDVSGSEFNHGPATGIYFYLSRVALPAMGLVFAYNINSEVYQFTASVGMSF